MSLFILSTFGIQDYAYIFESTSYGSNYTQPCRSRTCIHLLGLTPDIKDFHLMSAICSTALKPCRRLTKNRSSDLTNTLVQGLLLQRRLHTKHILLLLQRDAGSSLALDHRTVDAEYDIYPASIINIAITSQWALLLPRPLFHNFCLLSIEHPTITSFF
jgi:hypothetical protein